MQQPEQPKNPLSAEDKQRALDLEEKMSVLENAGVVLTRRLGEKILIEPGIEITLETSENERAQLRIRALPELKIYREEVIREKDEPSTTT